MRYKLKIEELDYDRNTIKTTEVWVTEEMIRSSNSIDVLKMCAEQMINKFRNDNNENKVIQERTDIAIMNDRVRESGYVSIKNMWGYNQPIEDSKNR